MSRERNKFRVLASAALVLGLACAPTPSMRGPQKMEQNYERLLKIWTQSEHIYHSLDSILLVHATYLAPEFRQAYGDQYLKIFSIDPGRVDSDLEKIATSIGRGHEFFVFADSGNAAWNNLEEHDSVWRIGLWGGDDQLGVPPISIHPFEGRGPNLSAFFPYLTRFGRTYLVVFPLDQANGKPVLNPANGRLTVKLSSAFGTATLSWKVAE